MSSSAPRSYPIFLGPPKTSLNWDAFHARCEIALGARLPKSRKLEESELYALGFIAAAAGDNHNKHYYAMANQGTGR